MGKPEVVEMVTKKLDLGDKEKGSGGIGDEELDLGDKGKGSGGNGDKKLDLGGG